MEGAPQWHWMLESGKDTELRSFRAGQKGASTVYTYSNLKLWDFCASMSYDDSADGEPITYLFVLAERKQIFMHRLTYRRQQPGFLFPESHKEDLEVPTYG